MVYEDTVCLSDSQDACVSKFPIFAIEHQEGLGKTDGILGISPKSDYSAPKMVYSELKKQKVIKKSTFGLYLDKDSKTT